MSVSALAAGISGLRTSQTALNVIGDNLANLNTSGFKSSRVLFADELSQTLSSAQAPGGGLGGKNPIQTGTGARVASIDINFAQGTLTPTGRPFDLAIQGDGFFVLTNGSQDFYTRVGAFNLDRNNDLVDSATGLKVKGTSATINIPITTVVPARATTNVNLAGNLDTETSTGAVNQVVTTVSAFTESSSAATAATLLNNLDQNSTPYANGDTIRVTGKEVNGTDVSKTFTYGVANDGTTLGDLRGFISASFGSATATIDASGNIVLTADAPGSSTHTLTLANGSGTGATTFPSFSVTTNGSGDVYVTTVPIFDAQGKSFPVTLTFNRQTANTWAVSATMKPVDGSIASLGITGINFNDNGSFASITGTTNLTVNLPGGGTQVVNLDLGLANSFTGLTQLSASSSAASISQDGYEAGFFLSSTVNADGTIDALFTNGQTQTLDQLQLATFSNPAGLSKQGRNLLLPSVASGLPVLTLALAGRVGLITSGALESSNVDIAEEFTKLIVSQRSFQANARTITTTDEVLQELVNIIR